MADSNNTEGFLIKKTIIVKHNFKTDNNVKRDL